MVITRIMRTIHLMKAQGASSATLHLEVAEEPFTFIAEDRGDCIILTAKNGNNEQISMETFSSDDSLGMLKFVENAVQTFIFNRWIEEYKVCEAVKDRSGEQGAPIQVLMHWHGKAEAWRAAAELIKNT